MSNDNDNTNEEKSSIDRAGDLAKNVWLAGLGAYGKAFDEAKDVYEKASKETPKLFDELVKKGEELEADTIDAINETKEKVSKGRFSDSLEERLHKVRGAFSFGSDNDADLVRIEDKLDALIKSVDGMKKTMTGLGKSVKALQADKVSAAPVSTSTPAAATSAE